jgi:hypothetical protein
VRPAARLGDFGALQRPTVVWPEDKIMPKKGRGGSKKKNKGTKKNWERGGAGGTAAVPGGARIQHRPPPKLSKGQPTENDFLDSSGVERSVIDQVTGQPVPVRWLRQNRQTLAVYLREMLDSALAQRLGGYNLCQTINVAVESGDYKKLRVMKNAGVKLGFAMTALNDHGCNLVNFAMVTQNKPLLTFMHECGADLSLACQGPPARTQYITPFMVASVEGWHSLGTLIRELIASRPHPHQCLTLARGEAIEDRPAAATTTSAADLAAAAAGEGVPLGEMSAEDTTIALGWEPTTEDKPSSLRFAASPEDAPAIPVVTVNMDTGERTHEDGSSLSGPAFLPASGAPIAEIKEEELPEGVSKDAIVPKPTEDPDPLVNELVKCQAAERLMAEMPSFEQVLEDERAAAKNKSRVDTD